jgi:phosphate transport system ATP-binding protein
LDAVRTECAASVRNVNAYYGTKRALEEVSLDIPRHAVTALIGPSGCGKSTFLRCLNRLNDRIEGFRLRGEIRVGDIDPYARGADLLELRRNVGMVFQKPNPFPKTIYENVAIGPRMHWGIRGTELDDVVEAALVEAALWDEVKDDWKRKSGLALSGGQQQRLCIARMLAVRPELILMDEPCSALDPISSAKIEALIQNLATNHTLVVVTHNLQQAERISDHTAFFMFGRVVEHGASEELFSRPANVATRDYVAGRFG